MKNKHSKEFRDRFLEILGSEPYRDINAIYFSGGVDSTTILFALLELGRRPDLISFKQEGIDSKDIEVGMAIAKAYNLNYQFCELRSDREGVVDDVQKVMSLIKHPLKTHIQCSIPFYHMSRELHKLGHTKAFSGIAADKIFGLNKKMNMMYSRCGEEELRRFRRTELYINPKLSSFDIALVSEDGGVELFDPYRDKQISEWMLNVPFKELHTGRDKSIAVDAFAGYWAKDEGWYRPRDNLQIVSGIRELHDNLILKDDSVNSKDPLFGKAKSIIKLYDDMRQNVESKTTTSLEGFYDNG